MTTTERRRRPADTSDAMDEYTDEYLEEDIASAESEPDEVDEALMDVAQAQQAVRQIEQAQQAQALLDTVNLDELVAPTVRVALMERYTHKVTLPDGSAGVRYEMRPRVAEITLFPSVGAQLKALAFSQQRAKLTQEQQLAVMLDCVLVVWRECEPDMTLERLQRGLDMQRVGKLFQMLFTPPSR